MGRFINFDKQQYIQQTIPIDYKFIDKKAMEAQQRHDVANESLNKLIMAEADTENFDPIARQQFLDESQGKIDKLVSDNYGNLSRNYSAVLKTLNSIKSDPYINLNKQHVERIKAEQLYKDKLQVAGKNPVSFGSVNRNLGSYQNGKYVLNNQIGDFDVEAKSNSIGIAKEIIKLHPDAYQTAFSGSDGYYQNSTTYQGISDAKVRKAAKNAIDNFKEADPQYIKRMANEMGINVASMTGKQAEQLMLQNGITQQQIDNNIYDLLYTANQDEVYSQTGRSSRKDLAAIDKRAREEAEKKAREEAKKTTQTDYTGEASLVPTEKRQKGIYTEMFDGTEDFYNRQSETNSDRKEEYRAELTNNKQYKDKFSAREELVLNKLGKLYTADTGNNITKEALYNTFTVNGVLDYQVANDYLTKIGRHYSGQPRNFFSGKTETRVDKRDYQKPSKNILSKKEFEKIKSEFTDLQTLNEEYIEQAIIANETEQGGQGYTWKNNLSTPNARTKVNADEKEGKGYFKGLSSSIFNVVSSDNPAYIHKFNPSNSELYDFSISPSGRAIFGVIQKDGSGNAASSNKFTVELKGNEQDEVVKAVLKDFNAPEPVINKYLARNKRIKSNKIYEYDENDNLQLIGEIPDNVVKHSNGTFSMDLGNGESLIFMDKNDLINTLTK